ncbi:hypothetical protein KI387_017637, partial [Taxus chinensis]
FLGRQRYLRVAGLEHSRILGGQYLYGTHFNLLRKQKFVHSRKCGEGFVGMYAGAHLFRKCMSSATNTLTEDPREKALGFLKDKKLVPESAPPSNEHLCLLYNFVEDSQKLVVLTGAGLSTECGIPDYRSPHGAYSSGFKPTTHQMNNSQTRSEKRSLSQPKKYGSGDVGDEIQVHSEP